MTAQPDNEFRKELPSSSPMARSCTAKAGSDTEDGRVENPEAIAFGMPVEGPARGTLSLVHQAFDRQTGVPAIGSATGTSARASSLALPVAFCRTNTGYRARRARRVSMQHDH